MTYLMSLRGSVPKQSRSVRFCVRHEIATPAGLAMTYECAMSRAIARGYVPLTAPTGGGSTSQCSHRLEHEASQLRRCRKAVTCA
jgi:hypothetical protein